MATFELFKDGQLVVQTDDEQELLSAVQASGTPQSTGADPASPVATETDREAQARQEEQ